MPNLDQYLRLFILYIGLFELFDVGSRCKINCKLEGLNKVSSNVHVMPLAKSNLESKKHMCDSVDQKAHFVFDSQKLWSD